MSILMNLGFYSAACSDVFSTLEWFDHGVVLFGDLLKKGQFFDSIKDDSQSLYCAYKRFISLGFELIETELSQTTFM